jgi:hypothetical protein
MDAPYLIEIFNTEERRDWNVLLAQNVNATVQQTTYWGDFLNRFYGSRVFPVMVANAKNEKVAVLLMYTIGLHPEIYYKKPFFNLIKRMVNYFQPTISWRDGPVFFGDENPAVLDVMLDFVEGFARRNNIRLINQVNLPIVSTPNEALEAVFMKRGYAKRLAATNMVDLTRTEEEIWAAFKGKVTRTPIRKAQSMGLVFRECTRDDIDAYFACEVEHGKYRQIAVPPKRRFEIMWDTLRPFECYGLFGAYAGKEALAFMPLRLFNKTAHIVKPVQFRRVFEERIPAGDFLMWECIRWAKSRGCVYFDLAGVAVNPLDEKEAGIRAFKEKWGGNHYEYSVFSKKI